MTLDCNQKRALARQERTGGDLTFEAGRPATGNRGCTLGTMTVRCKPIVFDQVAVALDQSLVALRTARVFPLADHAGKIAGIDVAKSGLAADFDGAQQVFRIRVAGDIVLHLVVAVKGGDVPGNVGRDARQEFGEAAKFVGVVVEAGDEKRDDLEPEPRLMNAADAIEDGSDAAAEFVVVTVVKALEIDFVQIEPGAQVFENLRSAVAVRNEAGDKSRGFGFFEDGYRPFAGDERLIVGADQNLRALGDGIADQKFGRGLEWRRDGAGIAQSLRRNPVLAVGAVQIAAQHAEAVGERTGIRVKKWLLLDRVALGSGGVSPGNVKRAAAIVADFANAGLAFGDGAAMSASEAAHAVVGELLVEAGIGLANSLVENTAEGGHGGHLLLFYAGAGAEFLVSGFWFLVWGLRFRIGSMNR